LIKYYYYYYRNVDMALFHSTVFATSIEVQPLMRRIKWYGLNTSGAQFSNVPAMKSAAVFYAPYPIERNIVNFLPLAVRNLTAVCK
jgi:hypothetical protein